MTVLNDDRLLVDAKEAARLLSLDRSVVYELVRSGVLERRYVGTGRRNFRIPVASLNAYVASLKSEPIDDD